MSKFRLGKKPLRLLVLLAVVASVLCGCSESKYAPVDQTTTVDSVTQETEMIAFTIGETGAEDALAGQAVAETESGEPESISYQDVHEWVVVTADVLNVRAADNTEARIYVQLKNGDLLERIGYHEEWSQVIYDEDVAYVASSMVEVTEAPVESETSVSETEAEAETETGEDIPVEAAAVLLNGHVIAIDAGHQAKANAEKEPIGPSSSTMKAKMPEGAVGAATGVKEYELTLTVAKKLEEELKARGYEIVMIRTGHDVNLSNAERSAIANESDADIFIRLHANSMENSGIYGALAMCMTEQNPYNSELYEESYHLSKMIINNICALTGTKNRGVQKVDNSSAINWCEIPVSVVEMGFLTNPDEDRWLQSEEYQGKIVEGIADAVDSYFAEEKN